MMSLNIDRDELGMALTDHSGVRWYFNRKTGEVLPDVEGDIDEDDESFCLIEPLPTHESYDMRVEFTDGIDNPVMKARLQDALRGKGAFRRFLDTVREHQDLESKWFAMEATWLRQKVAEWLEENGVTVA